MVVNWGSIEIVVNLSRILNYGGRGVGSVSQRGRERRQAQPEQLTRASRGSDDGADGGRGTRGGERRCEARRRGATRSQTEVPTGQWARGVSDAESGRQGEGPGPPVRGRGGLREAVGTDQNGTHRLRELGPPGREGRGLMHHR